MGRDVSLPEEPVRLIGGFYATDDGGAGVRSRHGGAGGLIANKATASLDVLQNAAATGVFRPRTQLTFGEFGGAAGLLTRSATYLTIVWPALLFGILISGAVRTLVSPRWLVERLGADRCACKSRPGLSPVRP